MEGTRALHMKGGTGEESYAKNSSLQRNCITNTIPIMEEAIKDVYTRLCPKTLCIADMGCSSGPNALYAVSLLMKAVVGHESSSSPEFLVYLNDLPSNDFNTIFRSLPEFQQDLNENMGSGFAIGPCFLTGVPGSFYGRLFPSQSLHFVHSANSLHWLSQAPKESYDNKGDIHISSADPSNMANAYLKQFNKDFSLFLKCRAIELVVGGCMVLTFPVRTTEDPAGAPRNGSTLGVFHKTLKDMVNEGLIEREKLDSFNIPVYKPLVSEVKALVEEDGSFSITNLGITDVYSQDDGPVDMVKTLRAAFEPLLATHFGEDKMDEVFSRLVGEDFNNFLSQWLTQAFNVTLFLTKKE